MKNKILVLSILLSSIFILSGCISREEAKIINERTLSSKGELVGKLPDGRNVLRWEIWSESGKVRHTVYVVDQATTISDNYAKSKTNKTNVIIINDKEYVEKK